MLRTKTSESANAQFPASSVPRFGGNVSRTAARMFAAPAAVVDRPVIMASVVDSQENNETIPPNQAVQDHTNEQHEHRTITMPVQHNEAAGQLRGQGHLLRRQGRVNDLRGRANAQSSAETPWNNATTTTCYLAAEVCQIRRGIIPARDAAESAVANGQIVATVPQERLQLSRPLTSEDIPAIPAMQGEGYHNTHNIVRKLLPQQVREEAQDALESNVRAKGVESREHANQLGHETQGQRRRSEHGHEERARTNDHAERLRSEAQASNNSGAMPSSLQAGRRPSRQVSDQPPFIPFPVALVTGFIAHFAPRNSSRGADSSNSTGDRRSWSTDPSFAPMRRAIADAARERRISRLIGSMRGI